MSSYLYFLDNYEAKTLHLEREIYRESMENINIKVCYKFERCLGAQLAESLASLHESFSNLQVKQLLELTNFWN